MEFNIGSVLLGAVSVVVIMLIHALYYHIQDKRAEKREAYNKLLRDVRFLDVHKDLQIDENHAISNKLDELSAKYNRLSLYCDELHAELFEMKEQSYLVPDSAWDEPVNDADEETYTKEFSVSDHVARREAEHDRRIAEMREQNRMEIYDIPHSIVDKQLADLPDVEETD